MDGRCRTCHSKGPCVCERVCASVCVHVHVPVPRVGTLCAGAAGTRRPPPRPHRRWTVPHKRGTRPAAVRSRPRPRAKGRTPSRRGQGPVPRPCDTGRFQHRTREPLPLWIRDAGERGGGAQSRTETPRAGVVSPSVPRLPWGTTPSPSRPLGADGRPSPH